MGYANSRHRLAPDRRQRHGRRSGHIGLVLCPVVCQAADAVGGMQEETALHRLVLRQHAVSDWQRPWHARGQ
jgi:hypothetical protein